MAFKLIESAQTRWQAVNAPRLVAPVRAGAVFKNGKLVERPDGSEGGPATILFARAPGVRRRPWGCLPGGHSMRIDFGRTTQKFVSLRIGENGPGFVAGMPDVDPVGAEPQ
jgi:hypothetical protein